MTTSFAPEKSVLENPAPVVDSGAAVDADSAVASEATVKSSPAFASGTAVEVSASAESRTSPQRLSSPFERLGLTGRGLSIANWLGVAVAVYVLISAVGVIGTGFQGATGGQAESLFSFATNPFVALMIGIVATALIQSSTTTTSIVVGLTAGGLPMEIAIPMLMGANVGTTLTSTLVSLGMVRDKESFRRGFTAASIHDCFNLLAVIIFLPLEMMFGVLERLSGWLSAQAAGSDGGLFATIFGGVGSTIKGATQPLTVTLESSVSFIPQPWQGIVLVVVGVALILAVINFIGTLLKVLMVGRAEQVLHAAIGRGSLSGIASGTLMTVMVQSSTTTTALVIPLAGSGKFSLKQIYPFTLGANIGTTLTALIAAFAFSGPAGQFALQAALVHLLYNLLAVSIIYGLPGLRQVPLRGATLIGNLGAENKLYVALWVLGIFLVLPLGIIGLTVLL